MEKSLTQKTISSQKSISIDIAFQQARQKENTIIEEALPDIDPGKAAEVCKMQECIQKAVQKIPNHP
jgi:hypothetical protein